MFFKEQNIVVISGQANGSSETGEAAADNYAMCLHDS
jgi:hypothetical protein